MKPRHTLGLAAVLALLCAGYWGMLHWRQESQHAAVEAKRLFSFDGAAVSSLEIQRVGEAASAASRRAEGGWSVQKPNASIRPMNLIWDRVASALAQLKNERTIIEKPEDIAQYGLAEPALTILARTGAEEEIRLIFGNKEPAEKYRYAQNADGKVFLVDDKAFFELNRPLDDLRNRFLVKDREAALLRLEFARIWTGRGKQPENAPAVGTESVNVVVERKAKDAEWRMTAPEDVLANQEAANALASEIQFAVGRDFIDAPEALSDYGLDPPAFRVTVSDEKDGQPQTMFFGERQGGAQAEAASGNAKEKKAANGLYAKLADQPAVFLVDTQLLSLFPQAPDSLRERHLLTREMSKLERVEYRAADGAGFALEKIGDAGWRVAEPVQTDTNQVAVSQYIALLKSVEAASFPGGGATEHGLDQPAATLTLTWAGETAPVTVRMKPVPGDDSYYYVTQDTGDVAMLHRGRAEQLMVTSDYFRSREVFRFNVLEAVKLEFRFEDRDYVLEKIHDTWVVKAPENMMLTNQSDALAILNAISPLVAREVETSAETPQPYGLEAPVFAMTVTTQAADGSKTALGPLRVGKVTEDKSDQRYASVEGRPGIFRIGQGVVDSVREALLGLRPR